MLLIWSAMADKSETWDEGLFISGGILQATHFNTNFDLTHPPLLRWIAGLGPVLIANAVAPDKPPFVQIEPIDLYQYKVAECFTYAKRTFYDTKNDHDAVLFWGRLPFAFFAIGLSYLIFSQLQKQFGHTSALLSAITFLFVPEVLAHSQWAHSDLASAFTVFLLSIVLARTLENPSVRNDIMVGVVLGIAITTKFTALLLIPFVLFLFVCYSPPTETYTRFSKSFKRLSIVCICSYAVVLIAYYPEANIFYPHYFLPKDVAQIFSLSVNDKLTNFFSTLLQYIPLPDSFVKGVVYTHLLGKRGLPTFLYGEIRFSGWHYFFPLAVFLKYPPPFLIAALLALRSVWRTQTWPRTRKLCFVGPPTLMFIFATMQGVNIGVRNVLFIAPFMALWIGILLDSVIKPIQRKAIYLLCALSIISGIATYPNFLTYFNPLVGGTDNAHEWLVDSNVDWGQDLPLLAKTLDQRNIDNIRLAYFGVADPTHWGIYSEDPTEIEPGWYAISRTLLTGLYSGDSYLWLNDLEAEEFVGGSIALIQVTEDQAKNAQSARQAKTVRRFNVNKKQSSD